MASILSDPNMMRYMGQMGLGLLSAGQAQPPGVNRYQGLMQSFNMANQNLMQSQLMDMRTEERKEKKEEREKRAAARDRFFDAAENKPITDAYFAQQGPGGPMDAGVDWSVAQGQPVDPMRRPSAAPGPSMRDLAQFAPEAAVGQMLAKEKPNRFTLGPGQRRYEDGKEVAAVPAAPIEAKNVSAITLRHTGTGESISLNRKDPRLRKFLGPDSPWVEETRQMTGELSASKKDELTGEIDLYERSIVGLDDMVAGIEANRGSAGIGGTASRWIQEGIGMATDLSEIGIDVPGAIESGMEELTNDVNIGRADPAIAGRFFNPALPENDVFENRLAYVLAKSRKGRGRLNVQDVQNAKKDVKITGLRSVDSVISKLHAVRKELFETQTDLKARRKQEAGGLPVYGMVDGKFQILEE